MIRSLTAKPEPGLEELQARMRATFRGAATGREPVGEFCWLTRTARLRFRALTLQRFNVFC
jgi:hypothetical protein